jgi:hypothetical protein
MKVTYCSKSNAIPCKKGYIPVSSWLQGLSLAAVEGAAAKQWQANQKVVAVTAACVLLLR